jgi:hypothetical protein
MASNAAEDGKRSAQTSVIGAKSPCQCHFRHLTVLETHLGELSCWSFRENTQDRSLRGSSLNGIIRCVGSEILNGPALWGRGDDAGACERASASSSCVPPGTPHTFAPVYAQFGDGVLLQCSLQASPKLDFLSTDIESTVFTH